MNNLVYKLIELSGSSTTSIEESISGAIQRAHKSFNYLSSFQVVEKRADLGVDQRYHWQVVVKVGFPLKKQIPAEP